MKMLAPYNGEVWDTGWGGDNVVSMVDTAGGGTYNPTVPPEYQKPVLTAPVIVTEEPQRTELVPVNGGYTNPTLVPTASQPKPYLNTPLIVEDQVIVPVAPVGAGSGVSVGNTGLPTYGDPVKVVNATITEQADQVINTTVPAGVTATGTTVGAGFQGVKSVASGGGGMVSTPLGPASLSTVDSTNKTLMYVAAGLGLLILAEVLRK